MKSQTAGEFAGEERDLGRFVQAVFEAWNSAGFPFVILRNYENLPNAVENDLDILVPSSKIRLAERRLVAAVQEEGYILHNRAEFTPVCLFFHHKSTLQQVQVDLFESLRFRAFDLLATGDTLERRLKRGKFATPHPVDEAILSLTTRLLYSGYIKSKYKPFILAVFKERPVEARASLANAFGHDRAEFLVNAVQAEDWGGIERKRKSLIRSLCASSLRHHPQRTLSTLVRDLWRLLRRLFKPPGLCVVLMGPDGCGKSAVAGEIGTILRHTFALDKSLRIHWKPSVFTRRRREDRQPVTDPHKQRPRSVLVSMLFLLFHWTEFALGAFLQTLPVVFRNGMVVIDRHYHDFLVDPLRYRMNVPRWAVKLGAVLLPNPDLVFVLDAPAEILQSRKQEVPIEETARQRAAYLKLVPAMPNGHVVDASQPLHQVSHKVVRTILEHLTERTNRRLGQRGD